MSLESVVGKADTILAGKVTGVASQQEDKNIYTLVTLAVEQVIKGEAAGEVTIKLPGGEAGGVTLAVTDYPGFKTDEKVLVFLNKDGGTYKIAGGLYGKYTINENNTVSDNKPLAEFIAQIKSIMEGTK